MSPTIETLRTKLRLRMADTHRVRAERVKDSQPSGTFQESGRGWSPAALTACLEE